MNLMTAYLQMYRIRTAENVIAEYFKSAGIFSFVHFCIGQEAIAVGVSLNLTTEDRVFGNHRSHGHYLAKGGNLPAMFAEMLGKETGCCKGKGGSMHLLDRRANFMGSTPILGSSIPIATGSALQQKMNNSGQITVVYLGDGAAEEGVFTESLNLAAAMSLPVVFVIEDNLYSVNTGKEVRRAEGHNFGVIAQGLGVRYESADGNNVKSVFETSSDLISYVRENSAPAILECVTYRHLAHSAPIFDDHVGYRKIDTLEVREKADPIKNLKLELEELHSRDEIENQEQKIRIEIEEALVFAINSAEPDPSQMLTGLFIK